MKFAVLDLVKTTEEIPLTQRGRLSQIRHNSLESYIRRFNPFAIEKIRLAGEEGYSVRLPITREDALRNEELAGYLMARTVETLREFGVGILLPPEGFFHLVSPSMRLAGKGLFPFFAGQAVHKALRLKGQIPRKAEVLIIAGEPTRTMAVVEDIYPQVNYLSLVNENPYNAKYYQFRAEEILAEAGLTLHVCGMNRFLLETADVVINLAPYQKRYDFCYRNGAAFLHFGPVGGEEELRGRRPDLLLADNLRVKAAGEAMRLEELELPFYGRCPEYRRYYHSLTPRKDAMAVYQHLRTLNAAVMSLTWAGKALASNKPALSPGP